MPKAAGGRRRKKSLDAPDYDFLAVRLAYTFHWTLEYVLSLTYPAFMELTSLVERVRADHAIDVDYSAYCAGNGKDAARELFKARGSFMLEKSDDCQREKPRITDADIAAARERIYRRILGKKAEDDAQG